MNTEAGIQPQEEGIDLLDFDGYLECIRKYFFQLLLVFLTVAALVTVFFNYSYSPSYSAKVTFAVVKKGDSGTDAGYAQYLSSSVSVLTSLQEFQTQLLEDVDPDTVNYSFSFSSSYTEESNLFTVSVSSNNYLNTNFILKRFREIFPEWSYKTYGNLKLEEVDVTESTRMPSQTYSLVKSAAMGAALGLVVCCGIIFLYALMLKTVRKESDMKAITGKNCIVRIPETKAKKRGSSNNRELLLLTNKHLDWKYRQAIQTIQTRVFQQMERNEQQVLMVASTIPQEGKTSVAVNLALSCVSQGKKVLVLDGDLRNPSVLKCFGIYEAALGLADYLCGDADLEDIIVSSSRLSLIASGKKKTSLSSVMNEKSMEDLFAYLRAEFDFIIVDSPPSAMFSDSAMMCEYADCVLYVVRSGKPTMVQVKEGIRSYIQNEKLIGYVFNRVTGSMVGYGGYGYSRSYRYGSYGYSRYHHYVDANLEKTEMNTEDSL